MEIRMCRLNRSLLQLCRLFASMLQIEKEDVVSVLGDDSGTDDPADVLSFDGLSEDSNTSDFLTSLLTTELANDAFDVRVSSADFAAPQDLDQTSVISSVAELLSDDTVSHLVRESLRYKVSSRSFGTSTSSSDYSTESSGQQQVPSEEDQERKAKRRRLNREWAKRDRHRRKTHEDSLQKKIEHLESENTKMEKEISDLKEEARELRACWHLHQVFYH